MARQLEARNLAAAVTVIDGASQMGSGSLPAQDLPTRLLAVQPKTMTPRRLAQRLRRYSPPVFVRIQSQQVLIDPRTLLEGGPTTVVDALAELPTHDTPTGR